MAEIDSLIVGSEKLVGIFGYWPSFHDAEILELHFARGDVRPDDAVYDFPSLTLKIHVFEMTKEVDSRGYFILRHHMLTTLEFRDVDAFEMQGFNHQNAMMELIIRREEREQRPSPNFAVQIDPAFGMGASFTCLSVEVVYAILCTPLGVPIAATPSS